MSVSSVYENPVGSPKWCVTVRSRDHVALHRFYTEEAAGEFRDYAVAAPDRLDYALRLAEAMLDGGEVADPRYPSAVHVLAELATAAGVDRMLEGRR